MASAPSPTPSHKTLRSLERDLHRTLRRFFEETDGRPEQPTRMWSPQMDVRETDQEYRIDMDLPGVSDDDITIDVDDHRLLVHGERPTPHTETDETVVRSERTRGLFSRRITLPNIADIDDASADFSEGILTIRVPKTDAHVSRNIPIS